jgi:4a-hydroxytetrahydrobiopterin dehydratase
MAKREKLTDETIRAFLSAREGWSVGTSATGGATPTLVKTYAFKHFGAAVGFAVHVGFAAEKQDHHPELVVTWGKVRVAWWTHDADGVTALDTEMAELTDRIYAG